MFIPSDKIITLDVMAIINQMFVALYLSEFTVSIRSSRFALFQRTEIMSIIIIDRFVGAKQGKRWSDDEKRMICAKYLLRPRTSKVDQQGLSRLFR